MQFSNALLLALGLVAGTQALPSQARGIIQFVFRFEAGPASYTLDVSPNGQTVDVPSIDQKIDVSIIDVPSGYNAIGLCTFATPKPATFTASISSDGSHHIDVGPPMPILSVTCKPETSSDEDY
ncbi:hypothetical protein F5Y16DRAFT_402509 [Xylariaceae sp. FL0255]|nr:hypothetical protein F5Y16DRAFT_402509 [Xylariaceae sp. FL0255]